jgi:hypothetical protein
VYILRSNTLGSYNMTGDVLKVESSIADSGDLFQVIKQGNTDFIVKNSGNVGHSDNRPGFRDVQIEYGGREEVARRDDLRTPGKCRQIAVIVRWSASAPSRFGYCFSAILPQCGPVFRAS